MATLGVEDHIYRLISPDYSQVSIGPCTYSRKTKYYLCHEEIRSSSCFNVVHLHKLVDKSFQLLGMY
jgi:hypothetical protein